MHVVLAAAAAKAGGLNYGVFSDTPGVSMCVCVCICVCVCMICVPR